MAFARAPTGCDAGTSGVRQRPCGRMLRDALQHPVTALVPLALQRFCVRERMPMYGELRIDWIAGRANVTGCGRVMTVAIIGDGAGHAE